MTKLELLKTYTPQQVRDSWANMGSSVVDNTCRYFNRDALVRVMQIGSPLYGSIVYVGQEGIIDADFDWINYTLVDSTGTEIQNQYAIIHPYLHVVLTATEFDTITAPVDTTWVPYSDPILNLPVQIPDEELNKILIDLGVPFINLDELEYSKDQILSLMIQPALDQYFRYFPIEKVYSWGVYTPDFDIEFPEGAVSVIRASNIPGLQGTGPSQGPNNPLTFWYDEFVQTHAGASHLGYSTHSRNRMYRPNDNISTMILERAVRSGIGNYMRRRRIKVYTEGRRVKGYCTERSTLEIVFGYTSTNWEDVPHNMRPQVRDLAKAYVLKAFSQLRAQARSDVAGTLNYDRMYNESKELEKQIIDLWQQATKAVIIRS